MGDTLAQDYFGAYFVSWPPSLYQRNSEAFARQDTLNFALLANATVHSLPKGVLRAEYAVHCAACGVDALILSNHGARQLDGTISSLEELAVIAANVQVPILLDSGVRRGANALTSLCLGATMVGLGRVTLYTLASDDQQGVERCLEILTDELMRGMALLGASSIAQLDHTLVRRSN
jgi:(S)-mandelate dehydrogenase